MYIMLSSLVSTVNILFLFFFRHFVRFIYFRCSVFSYRFSDEIVQQLPFFSIFFFVVKLMPFLFVLSFEEVGVTSN
jgi:hypothetical protein